MNVGFTGTQRGMTREQQAKVAKLLVEFLEREGDRFHHGDCIGADFEAAGYADALGYVMIAHPASDVAEKKLGRYQPIGFLCLQSERWAPRPALARNRTIVANCDVLIAAPFEENEQLRSGTWSTVRYANKVGRRVELVDRHGVVRKEWH